MHRAQQLFHDTEVICARARSIDTQRIRSPKPSWTNRAKEFLKKLSEGDVKPNTLKLQRKVINKFVKWLIRNNERPTT